MSLTLEEFEDTLNACSFEDVCMYERIVRKVWHNKRTARERERMNSQLKTLVMCYKLYPNRFDEEGTGVTYTETHMIDITREFSFKDFASHIDVMDTDDIDLGSFLDMAFDTAGDEDDRRDDTTIEDYAITVHDVPHEVREACGLSAWQSLETYFLGE